MTTEIIIRVVTNIDHLKYTKWPESLACKPSLGDVIRSVDNRTDAKITRIVHCYGIHRKGSYNNVPYLELEVFQQVKL